MNDQLIITWRNLAKRWRNYAADCVDPQQKKVFEAAAGERTKCADELAVALAALREGHQLALSEQRMIGHSDGQRHAVEDVAIFVEHLRNEYLCSTEAVTKIARLIREHFDEAVYLEEPKQPT